MLYNETWLAFQALQRCMATAGSTCWRSVLYKNDPVYLDFLKVEGGTEGGL